MKSIIISTEIKLYNIEELNNIEQKLINASENAAKLAYAPYSKFKVGASLLLSNGTIINGSNQENASFPVGICAERVALANHAMQFPNENIESIAIYADNKTDQPPAAPCGMCRQALYEQEAKQKTSIKILLKGNGNEIVAVNSVKDLLPLAFSGEQL